MKHHDRWQGQNLPGRPRTTTTTLWMAEIKGCSNKNCPWQGFLSQELPSKSEYRLPFVQNMPLNQLRTLQRGLSLSKLAHDWSDLLDDFNREDKGPTAHVSLQQAGKKSLKVATEDREDRTSPSSGWAGTGILLLRFSPLLYSLAQQLWAKESFYMHPIWWK
jgi:hypothetical protein